MKTLLYAFWAVFLVGVGTMQHGKKTHAAAPKTVKKESTDRFLDTLSKTARLDAGVMELRQKISLSEIGLKNLKLEMLQKSTKPDSIFVDPGILCRTKHTQ